MTLDEFASWIPEGYTLLGEWGYELYVDGTSMYWEVDHTLSEGENT